MTVDNFLTEYQTGWKTEHLREKANQSGWITEKLVKNECQLIHLFVILTAFSRFHYKLTKKRTSTSNEEGNGKQKIYYTFDQIDISSNLYIISYSFVICAEKT